jgi:hypothetical protein
MANINEQWADVIGYEGHYVVSNLGRVASVDKTVAGKNSTMRRIKGRILSPGVSTKGKGYPVVSLWRDGAGRSREVHRLVALAFCANANHAPEVNHKDGDPKNNASSNLEWCTHAQNMHHAAVTGLVSKKASRFSNDDVLCMRALRAYGKSYCSIAKTFATSRGYVREICLFLVRK